MWCTSMQPVVKVLFHVCTSHEAVASWVTQAKVLCENLPEETHNIVQAMFQSLEAHVSRYQDDGEARQEDDEVWQLPSRVARCFAHALADVEAALEAAAEPIQRKAEGSSEHADDASPESARQGTGTKEPQGDAVVQSLAASNDGTHGADHGDGGGHAVVQRPKRRQLGRRMMRIDGHHQALLACGTVRLSVIEDASRLSCGEAVTHGDGATCQRGPSAPGTPGGPPGSCDGDGVGGGSSTTAAVDRKVMSFGMGVCSSSALSEKK